MSSPCRTSAHRDLCMVLQEVAQISPSCRPKHCVIGHAAGYLRCTASDVPRRYPPVPAAWRRKFSMEIGGSNAAQLPVAHKARRGTTCMSRRLGHAFIRRYLLGLPGILHGQGCKSFESEVFHDCRVAARRGPWRLTSLLRLPRTIQVRQGSTGTMQTRPPHACGGPRKISHQAGNRSRPGCLKSLYPIMHPHCS